MKKQEFKEKSKLSIDKANSKIAELELLMQEVKTNTESEYEEQIQNLKKKKVSLEAKYHKLSEITEDKWEETKEDFLESMRDLKSKIRNIFD